MKLNKSDNEAINTFITLVTQKRDLEIKPIIDTVRKCNNDLELAASVIMECV